MAKITDAAIRTAIRDVDAGRKQSVILTDPAPRGSGRLMLAVQPGRAEWYARRFVRGKPKKVKMGNSPAMPLTEARNLFKGGVENVKAPKGSPTLRAMFDGYLASLREARKPSADQAERLLAIAAEKIGPETIASDVTPADVVAVIKPVYDRGARVQADKFRMYMGAAFRWAMKTTHDYRTDGARNWGIKANPVDSVARDNEAEGVGNRWLSEAEYRELLAALDGPSRRTRVRQAIALLMLTGQRVREVLHLKAGQWNSAERLLTWEKTKNGKPHLLPVCAHAAAILDGLTPGDGGWLFPSEKDGQPQPDGAVLVWLKRYAKAAGVEPFTGRDLRRTWKTLAGEAGLTKVERDLLQNHTEGDVSSRHYDRWSYMPEKRAAVEKWQAWVEKKDPR